MWGGRRHANGWTQANFKQPTRGGLGWRGVWRVFPLGYGMKGSVSSDAHQDSLPNWHHTGYHAKRSFVKEHLPNRVWRVEVHDRICAFEPQVERLVIVA